MKPIHPEAQDLLNLILRNHPELAEVIAPTVERYREQSSYDPTDEILLGWTTDDMYAACRTYGKDLSSDEDAIAMLERCAKRFDANIGLDWGLIWMYAQELEQEGAITLLDYQNEDESTE